jgi:hypothetical protein
MLLVSGAQAATGNKSFLPPLSPAARLDSRLSLLLQLGSTPIFPPLDLIFACNMKYRDGKSIKLNFGGHVRDKNITPNDTLDEIYADIRSLFHPHIGSNTEIEILRSGPANKTGIWYYALLNGGSYRVGVSKPPKRKRALKKTEIAVHIIMRNWAIPDDRYLILPASIAPATMSRDNAAPCTEPLKVKIVDPHLWPTKLAEKLRSLSRFNPGIDGHKQVIQQLECAIAERVELDEDDDKGPSFSEEWVRIRDVKSVLRFYEEKKKADEENAKDKQHVHAPLSLPFHPKPDTSAEKKGGTPEDYKQSPRDLPLRQASRQEDKGTSEG